jgi:hypothetical protein
MTPPRAELEVLLRVGPDTRSIPVAALAAITHQPSATLREVLSRLFFALFDRTAETDSRVSSGNQTEGKRFYVEPNVNVQNEEDRNVDVNVEERAGVESPTFRALTAERLASELRDPHSVPYFRQLLAEEPAELLSAALAETLARCAEIHGRPGAYFIGVLRALKRARILHLHSYARTPPSAS